LIPPSRLAWILSSFQIFVEDHRQAIWEATHSFPISKAKQKAEAWAAAFYSGRKNRSSYAREKLRVWEAQGLAEIRQSGCYDLDILLDPAFVRFPQLSEDATWFPGREALAEGRVPPSDLKTAVEDCDRSAPCIVADSQPRSSVPARQHAFLKDLAEQVSALLEDQWTRTQERAQLSHSQTGQLHDQLVDLLSQSYTTGLQMQQNERKMEQLGVAHEHAAVRQGLQSVEL
jgi:hypothetical protein